MQVGVAPQQDFVVGQGRGGHGGSQNALANALGAHNHCLLIEPEDGWYSKDS
ncbi:hypothetical protein GCM10007052_22230 [Halioglobus japonicus]|nr:hypothetical protein GCM10007052_22230 [Halioglobus japonicus]